MIVCPEYQPLGQALPLESPYHYVRMSRTSTIRASSSTRASTRSGLASVVPNVNHSGKLFHEDIWRNAQPVHSPERQPFGQALPPLKSRPAAQAVNHSGKLFHVRHPELLRGRWVRVPNVNHSGKVLPRTVCCSPDTQTRMSQTSTVRTSSSTPWSASTTPYRSSTGSLAFPEVPNISRPGKLSPRGHEPEKPEVLLAQTLSRASAAQASSSTSCPENRRSPQNRPEPSTIQRQALPTGRHAVRSISQVSAVWPNSSTDHLDNAVN